MSIYMLLMHRLAQIVRTQRLSNSMSFESEDTGYSSSRTPPLTIVRKRLSEVNDLGKKSLPPELVLQVGNQGTAWLNYSSSMKDDQQGFVHSSTRKHQRSSDKFKKTLLLAIRVGCGVLLAGVLNSSNPMNFVFSEDKTGKPKPAWYLPSFYYLGGLSNSAASLIFSIGKTLGETIQLSWQTSCGTILALLFNMVLFHVLPPTRAGLITIDRAYSGEFYQVSQFDVNVALPFLMLFTFIIQMIPMQTTTKKFAIGMNAYFALTIINPMDPSNPDQARTPDQAREHINSIMINFLVYFMIGVGGCLLATLVMLVPTPIFAMHILKKEATDVQQDINLALNVILDTYTLKQKRTSQVELINLRLKIIFKRLQVRLDNMADLLDQVWWEQLVGLHLLLKFKKGVYSQYYKLATSLVFHLRGMKQAMDLEISDSMQEKTMLFLRQDIYKVQMKARDLSTEILQEVQNSTTVLQLRKAKSLRNVLKRMLSMYARKHRNVLSDLPDGAGAERSIEQNMTLNLFFFSFVSYCEAILNFETKFNKKRFNSSYRTKSFIRRSLLHHFTKSQYTWHQTLGAIKVTIAVAAAVVPSIYVYRFSSTAPSAIAYVMGCYLGGSFGTTSNRVIGVVAGSVVPSIFKIYAAELQHDLVGNILLGSFLFVWTTCSMYIYFDDGQSSYAGLVSAFISAGILLEPAAPSTSASYGSLVQTSVGMLIFISVELTLWPKSATWLLRKNIQASLTGSQEAFRVLAHHHAPMRSGPSDFKALGVANSLVEESLPALLRTQRRLVREATLEPALWRPEFCLPKYEGILKNLHELLRYLTLLNNIIDWQARRNEANVVGLTTKNSSDNASTQHRWLYTGSQGFKIIIEDGFETLLTMFNENNLHTPLDETVLYLQMKEAFRLADKDCSGTIDKIEITEMLKNAVGSDSEVSGTNLEEMVEQFLTLVDSGKNGFITFTEFMHAVENGLLVKVRLENRNREESDVSEVSQARTNSQFSQHFKTHNMINVDSDTLEDCYFELQQTYVHWVLAGATNIEIDDLLVVSCFISGVRGISKLLVKLEHSTLRE